MSGDVSLPTRRWGPRERPPEVAPTVLVSSHDAAPVPRVAGAAKLAEAAQSHGWAVRLTYALAAVPERFHLNGNLAKAAHQLASVAVRLARGCVRGWAIWHREDEGGWRFVVAYMGTERYGLRSIVDRVATAA